MARLGDFYKAEVAPALMKKYEYKSPMQIPKFDKIVINVGCGDAKDNAKVIDSVLMPGAVVEEGAIVTRALVADDVQIGKQAVVGSADSEHIELVAKRVKGAE